MKSEDRAKYVIFLPKAWGDAARRAAERFTPKAQPLPSASGGHPPHELGREIKQNL